MGRRPRSCRRRRGGLRISPASRSCDGGVERRGRLVQQPDRPLAPRPAGRSTAAAAGRRTDSPPAGLPAASRSTASSAARIGRRRRRDNRAQNCRFSLTDSDGFERVLVAEIMGLLGQSRSRVSPPLECQAARRICVPARRSCAAARICRRRCGRSPPALRHRTDCEIEAGKDLAAATAADQIVADKLHQAWPRAAADIRSAAADIVRQHQHFQHFLLQSVVNMASKREKTLISPASTALINEFGRKSHRREKSCLASNLDQYHRLCPAPGMETDAHDFARQLQMLQDPQGRQQDLRLLQPAGRREERAQGHFPPAVLAEGAAGEPAAQRRRPHGDQGRHPGGRRMAEDQDVGARIRVPAGARADAGFHRRAGGGRSRRHARRHEEARRRSQEDQSAGAGRSRHRPLGRGQLLRQQRTRSRRTSRRSTGRTRSATNS